MTLLPFGFGLTTTPTVREKSRQNHAVTGTKSLQIHKLSSQKNEMSVDDMFAQLERIDPRANAAIEEGTKWVAKTFFSEHPESLAILRMRAGLSQNELGKRLGVSQPQIAKWEKCKTPNLQINTIKALAQALSIDSHELFRVLVNEDSGEMHNEH